MNGEAWLATRWLEPITAARELRTQLRKGRVTARRGRVEGLTVRPGLATAEVLSDMGGTNMVRLRMKPIDDAVWDEVLGVLSGEAGYAAVLLGGRLTEEVARVFEDAGVELFPFALRDVTNFCSCRDDSGPLCMHAVATHVALADAMTHDPFVLFELRGRTKGSILEELRRRRPRAAATEDEGSIELEDAARLADGYWERGIVPHLAFRFGTTELDEDESLPVIRALGPGPGEVPPDQVSHVLSPLAWVGRKRIDSIIEHVEVADEEALEAPDPTGTQSLDDLLVAAAHQHGVLTTGFVAHALGIAPGEARRYLQWLVEERRLEARGRGRASHYVLPGTPYDDELDDDELDDDELDFSGEEE